MSLSIHFGPVENWPHLSILRECVDREIIWNLKLKDDSQYNFLRRDMRFPTLLRQRHTVHNIHVCDGLMRISSTMHVHCMCTQGRNCTPFVYVACRMSQKLNFLQLLRQVHCDGLRQLGTGSFLSQLSQIACCVAKSCKVNRP